jgi:hypothetical protein
MTVQEAISELRKQVIFTEVYFPKDPALRSYAKALSMAIEALKAVAVDEPDNDHIDEDIQAADMAAEDMPDNEDIPFC